MIEGELPSQQILEVENSMKIKICGLRRQRDIDYVNLGRPDMVGFVFAGKKRRIDYKTAECLKERLNPEVKAVGVFVNEERAYIEGLIANGIIDMVQLHGDEDEAYIERLRQSVQRIGKGNIPFMKAVRVRSMKQVCEAEKLPVDYLLLDAFTDGEYGGSGKQFNYNLIPDLKKPYFLAGGIDFENVTEIVEKIRGKNVSLPCCLDISSSVEVDGYKDKDRVMRIISLVRTL